MVHLPRNGLHSWQGEVRVLALIPVVLLELIKIGAQKLTDQEQVLLHAMQS